MSLWDIGGSLLGGFLGYQDAQNQNEASLEAIEASKALPAWLEAYITGPASNIDYSVPLNPEWLSQMQNVAATGMPAGASTGQPGGIVPMSMNNPRITGVMESNPAPRQLVEEPAQQGGGGIMSDEMLALAQQYQNASKLSNSWSEVPQQGPSTLEAMRWAQQNEDADDMDAYKQGLLHQIRRQSGNG